MRHVQVQDETLCIRVSQEYDESCLEEDNGDY